MNLKEDIKPISYLKTNAAKMLKYINETQSPIIITQNGEAKGILLDIESYQLMRNSIGILKILSQSERDIEKKKLHLQENVFSELELKLKDKIGE